MGGSGGVGFGAFPPDALRRLLEEAGDATNKAEHDSEVNRALNDLLAQYNRRDVDLTRTRLNEIANVLEDFLDTTIDMRFGGSVAKHTYVDGLSDVDALAILRSREMGSATSGEVLDKFADILERRMSYNVNVNEGRLAVTITYPDEMQIQILPAIRTATGVRIPAATSDKWSTVVRPEAFARKLTERNEACNGRLVPLIKLAKGALVNLPESYRPTGYHVESLAVKAFEGYSGPTNHKAMLHHFFERGSTLVMNPISDSTGQSLSVDEKLGPPKSVSRQLLGGEMGRIARRMSNADGAGSSDAWLAAIDE